MKFKSANYSIIMKSLAQSFPLETMIAIARMVFPSYNMHERLGFNPSIPVTCQTAARQIVNDAGDADMFLDLVEAMIRVSVKGYMGKKFPLGHSRAILLGITSEGFLFDAETCRFFEDSRASRTPNWNRLREGQDYNVTLVRLDIAGNSEIVRSNKQASVHAAYGAFRNIAASCVEKRDGRIWQWEGDGGLAAFHYGAQGTKAVHASMEILNQLCVYNLFQNSLNTPLSVRIAVHGGPIHYSFKESELLRNETVKEAIEVESRHTAPGTISVSSTISQYLDKTIQNALVAHDGNCPWSLLSYGIKKAESACK